MLGNHGYALAIMYNRVALQSPLGFRSSAFGKIMPSIRIVSISGIKAIDKIMGAEAPRFQYSVVSVLSSAMPASSVLLVMPRMPYMIMSSAPTMPM